MASSIIKYSLYKDSGKLEATRLRSILLFNGKVEKQKRQDLMTKAILSLILQENGHSTRNQIVSQLRIQFNVFFQETDIDDHIKKLFKSGLIESVDEPFKVNENENDGDFFQKLDKETEALFEGIIDKTSEIYGEIHYPDILKNTIRKALSIYFGMYGYTFFGAQKKEEDPVMNSAVNVVKDDIRDNRLAESLILALAGVIEHPNVFQEMVLTKWARAFVAMETMSLDPLLRNLKRRNLKEKEFIIDTDVVLHCLATKSRFSKDYRQMFETIKEIGCKIYIVPEVVTEIRKHIDAAVKQEKFYGRQLLEFPDDVIYEKICNVFIDDYVHIAREEKEPISFRDYIEEFYDPDFPQSQILLLRKLKSFFTEDVFNRTFNVDTTSQRFIDLDAEVYNLTMLTSKAQNRSEEENLEVSWLDTYHYIAASNSNEKEDSLEMLAGKTYIITDSTRAMRAAANLRWKKEDVVCHPNALIAILMELGSVKSNESIINLFDNPFLVHVADKIWDIVDPLLKEGATIKNKGFDKLRYDVDKCIDRLLTDSFKEGKKEILTEYGIYLPDMVDEGKERELLQIQEISRLREENKELRKSLIEARSLKAKSTKRINQKSSRNKRRGKRR